LASNPRRVNRLSIANKEIIDEFPILPKIGRQNPHLILQEQDICVEFGVVGFKNKISFL
jgi:hypothetical protein